MSKPERAGQNGFTKTERARYRATMAHVESRTYSGPFSVNVAKEVLDATRQDGTYRVRGLSPGKVMGVGFELVHSRDNRYFVPMVEVPWQEFADMGRKRDLVLQRTDNYVPSGRRVGKKAKGRKS